MANGSSEGLDDLERQVENAIENEVLLHPVFDSDISINDLDLKDGKNTFRPRTTRLEVYKEWKVLVKVLQEQQVFWEYLPGLQDSLQELRHNIDATEYRHIKTLVGLLAHTAENHARDSSTQCRFVTLLEVMLTYHHQWQPSAHVIDFWVRIMQRIPADMPPVNFRRKAYRVLVSLSWVPSSKGLLEACSFEENRLKFNHEGAPTGAKALLARIKNRPLPRYDCVNQLLDRLKDETDVCVAINSEREGCGKTILAALVSSHTSILRAFVVLWLNIKEGQSLTLETYIRYLNDLCEQLGEQPRWPECDKRFEEPALRKLRDQHCMAQARKIMSEILLRLDKNILLVLDDVSDASVIDWFRFSERQSIVVTTTDPNLEGVDWTVVLEPMSKEEAIELFLKEADFPATHAIGCTLEVASIVERCEYNPLCIRSVARWYKFKHVTAGIAQGMEEIVSEIVNFKGKERQPSLVSDNADGKCSDDDEPSTILFDILSLMMCPSNVKGNHGMSAIFVLCFAALAVVFPDKAPLDAVLLLWTQILKVEPIASNELSESCGDMTDVDFRKHAWLIAEGLAHMGVISVADKDDGKNPWVEIHHNFYRDFAIFMAKEMDFGSQTFEETSEEWNKAFVMAYFTERIQGDSTRADDNSWEYAIEKLPQHMLLARMFPLANTILSDETFFRARVEIIGWKRAIDAQIEDCVMLQRALEGGFEHSSSESSFPEVSAAFSATAAMVATNAEGMLESSETSFVDEVSRSLFKIGFALAEIGDFEKAIANFDKALSLEPQSQSLCASIHYGSSWTTLLVNNIEMALKRVKTSKKLMEESQENHVLYNEVLLLEGDALFAQCEYKDAAACFEQVVDLMKLANTDNQIELGLALHKKGKLHHTMGQLEEAKTVLSECVRWKLELGEISRNLSLTYSALGDVQMERRELSDAKENYTLALQALDTLKYKPDHIDHLLVTGKLRFLQNNYSGCFESLELARSAIVRAPSLLMDKSAFDIRCIAQRYRGQGDLDNAVKLLNESLSLTNEYSLSLERSSGFLELALCLLDKGQTDEGLVYLEKSLETQIVKLGACKPVIETLTRIGNIHFSVDSFDEALKVFEKVNELIEQISPDDTERIGGILHSIAETYEEKGDYDKAIAKFTESIDKLKRGCSSDHPDIAKALQRLGDIAGGDGELEMAIEYYSEALRIRRMGFDAKLEAESLHCLGVMTRRQGEAQLAKHFLEDALEIRRKHPDISGRETAETLLDIGNCCRVLFEPKDAIRLFEQALEVLPEGDEFFGTVYLAIGHVKLFFGQFSEAIEFYEKSRDIILDAFGKDDMQTGYTSRSLGIAKYLSNRGEEALVHLNEFVRVCELSDGDEGSDSIDYVVAVMLLGDIYTANRKMEQARNVYLVAGEILDDNEGLQEEVEGLHEMIGLRLGANPRNQKGGPTFALDLDPSDVEVIQKIIFLDE